MKEASGGYRALVLGATGLVGSALLQQLLADPQCAAVTILVRRPLRPSPDMGTYGSKLTVLTADFDRMEEALTGVEADTVFCALGTTIKKAGTQEAFRVVDLEYPVRLAEWAKAHGADRYMVVSAMGANASSSIFYNRVKGEMEARITEIGLPELHIVRPSLLLGKREEFRLGEKLAIMLSPLMKLLMVGRLRMYRPVQAEDVAAFMVKCAQTGLASGDRPVVELYENGAITATI
ncbi:putative NAD(P)-binding protein [Paenibacillus taihuensis]|uniref:Putative NAD(P)-binding protein n=1 Tax=Paenibacillus taihuensis TaxID=1156355 RepID=A0A3D9RV30_9BACL|nr:oxidoreductase [Paenibacillus taihuensis]REE83843.1 putative NAD(P)-binding protein [Paenibacillus taihuensis]